MKVRTLKANFKKEFGATLRVYTTENCKAIADDEVTIGSFMTSSAKGGVPTIGDNLRVGNFEKKIAEPYGVGVQVANAKNTELSSDSITLVVAGKKQFTYMSMEHYPSVVSPLTIYPS